MLRRNRRGMLTRGERRSSSPAERMSSTSHSAMAANTATYQAMKVENGISTMSCTAINNVCPMRRPNSRMNTGRVLRPSDRL